MSLSSSKRNGIGYLPSGSTSYEAFPMKKPKDLCNIPDADICLTCTKKNCMGSAKCVEKQKRKRIPPDDFGWDTK